VCGLQDPLEWTPREIAWAAEFRERVAWRRNARIEAAIVNVGVRILKALGVRDVQYADPAEFDPYEAENHRKSGTPLNAIFAACKKAGPGKTMTWAELLQENADERRSD